MATTAVSPCTRRPHRVRRMRKRRLSIQAIFNRDVEPPKDGKFKTLPRSFVATAVKDRDTPAADSADSFLLDDDPFADLTHGPRSSNDAASVPPIPAEPVRDTPPTSPLAEHAPLPPIPTRSHTHSNIHTTPAYQKPAFKPRPSLPSLHTLAQMSVVVPHKVRRGRVGAGLPFEPWDLDTEGFTASPASASSSDVPLIPTLPVPIPPKPQTESTDHDLSTTPTPASQLSTTPTAANISAPTSPKPQGKSTPTSPARETVPLLSLAEFAAAAHTTDASAILDLDPDASLLLLGPPSPPLDSAYGGIDDEFELEADPDVENADIEDEDLSFALDLASQFNDDLSGEADPSFAAPQSQVPKQEQEAALGRNTSRRLSAQRAIASVPVVAPGPASPVLVPKRSSSLRAATRTEEVEGRSATSPIPEAQGEEAEVDVVDVEADEEKGEEEVADAGSASGGGDESESSSGTGTRSGTPDSSVPTSPYTTRNTRRRFRKSSLVGDVLRFAPASPDSPSSLDAVRPAGEGEPQAQAPIALGLDLDGGDAALMEGMGVWVDGVNVDIQLADMDLGAGAGGGEEKDQDELGLNLHPLNNFIAERSSSSLSVFEMELESQRTSAFSMVNQIGHEPLEGNGEVEFDPYDGLASPVAGAAAFPALHSYSPRSPFSTRSPERYFSVRASPPEGYSYSSPPEGYASPASVHSPDRYDASIHSPPYSTPYATSAASTSSTSETSFDFAPSEKRAAEFDFGWLPHERPSASASTSASPSTSASASVSEYEYDGSDFDGMYYENGNSDVYNGHVHARFGFDKSRHTSAYGSFSSTPAYSDDELLDFECTDENDDTASTRALNGEKTRGAAFSGDRGRSFVFPARLAAAEEEGEAGTSAGTIRASAQKPRRDAACWVDEEGNSFCAGGKARAVGDGREGELVDASGWEGSSSGGRGYSSSGGGGSRSRSAARGGGGDDGYYGSYGGGGGGGGWAGGDDRDGDDRRNPTRSSAFSTPSSSDSEDDEDESEDDYYGEPSPGLGSTSNNQSSSGTPANNGTDGSDDDDVPLAQRIPSALTAQRTIRRKVREERDQRRRDRAERRGEEARSRQTTLRPRGAGDASNAMDIASSSSREAARQAEAAIARAARQRTQTLPGNGATQSQSVAVDDLTKKLQSMQSQAERERQRALSVNTANTGSGKERRMVSPSPARGPSATSSPPPNYQALPEAARALRPMRSFRRPTTADGALPPKTAEVRVRRRDHSTHRSQGEDTLDQAAGEGRVKRSMTTRRPADDSSRSQQPEDIPVRRRDHSTHRSQVEDTLDQAAGEGRVKRSMTTRRPADDSSRLQQPEDIPGRRRDHSTHRSQGEDTLDQAAGEGRVKRSMTTRRPADDPSRLQQPEDMPAAPVRRSATTRRPADDRSQALPPKERGLTMPAFLSEPPPPTPTLPAATPASTPSNKLTKPRPSGEMLPLPAYLRRRSLADDAPARFFQRFNMVDIGPSTSAKQVLAMVEEQGSLKGWVGTGGWMVWEVAQDFGMERPIRSFELLADIQASWNKEKMVNLFMIKLTPLAPILSRSNIPSSSPVYSGFVDWEMKRGKWTKRYLRLREHSLYLSKRESQKDEVFLCSLSNFDAYTVTRLHKAPKPFVFGVKSTDNLSFFENTADYMHIFACDAKDGEKWIERILLARSYVLFQERNVLFNPKSPAGNAASAGPSGLSRAPTRKSANTPQRPAQQPLVTVAPLLVTPDRNDVFAPGSLLHGAPIGPSATQ
ncbi:PH domain-containing protein [Mycena sanguinolenta]|uniref:PH domain-containing protein n=1 Tax=Mycena sanguinolenta TaxID=230812 RepID=A0A8H6XXY1_9AGAR|nr:PH domain-containing protein [Mycena sanguinolenta]